MTPAFSFEKMVHGHSHCVSKCPTEHLANLLLTLFNLSQLSWQDIVNSHRHELGTEKIERESIHDKQGISKCPEGATILSIRYYNHYPFIGYRDGRIFYILCIDYDFKVYDH
ncbi:hypothetical protein [Candidatus Liberibacter sp.]|uniref:hypothetical protein n=1 Tax=Candidatus Liberibacter sp. TaxID=34022 RepID=UPI0015F4D296|nr:hypothetical protein [Candidatus Liberibacter sp.]MBA5724625.1 hypothetical protein [Candidatus Liberibacter sp.]